MNPEQTLAAGCTDQDSLIIACPGSGKTRTIIGKTLRLVDGLNPGDRIVLVTFTRKAALQLAERLGRASSNVMVGTFHSLAFRVMRLHRYDQYGGVVHMMTSAESVALRRDVVAATDEEREEVYREAKRRERKKDFQDLLIDMSRFLEHPSSLVFRESTKHLMVDEYQDINDLQESIIRSWISRGCCLTAVGDDGQSIYAFRGASIGHILGFCSQNARRFTLTQNYRNPPSVIRFAQRVIGQNTGQISKKMVATKRGGSVVIEGFANQHREARYIADQAAKHIQDLTKTPSPGDSPVCAILVRYHVQSPAIEFALRRRSVPYTIVRSRSIFDQPCIAVLLSMTRLQMDQSLSRDWVRVLCFLPGIGPKTAQKLSNAAARVTDTGKDFADSVLISGAPRSWKTGVDTVMWLKTRQSVPSCIHRLDELLVEKLRHASSPKVVERVEGHRLQLKRFRRAIAGMDTTDSNNLAASLLLDADSGAGAESSPPECTPVHLMTIHASKGLEFPNCIVAGVSSDTFPRPTLTLAEREEERRLLYVAITRTEDTLVVTHIGQPSMFIKSALRRREVFAQER